MRWILHIRQALQPAVTPVQFQPMKWTQTILAGCLALLCSYSLADDTTPTDHAGTSSGGWFNEPAQAAPASSKASETGSRAKKPTARPQGQATGGTDYAPAQDLLLSAMSLIGVKYKWGGNTPESGLDCSGFVRYVFTNSMNITLPRTAFEMAQRGQSIDKEDLKPGDLVFFNTLGRTFSHVGIYLGDNRFIHSPRSGRSVEIVDMNQRYWQQRWNGGRRITDAGGENVNINALLASGNTSRSSKAATETTASSGKQCRKVTTGKGSRKKTTTICTRDSTPAAKPPSTAKKSSKASKSTKTSKSSGKAASSKKATSSSKKATSSKTTKKKQ